MIVVPHALAMRRFKGMRTLSRLVTAACVVLSLAAQAAAPRIPLETPVSLDLERRSAGTVYLPAEIPGYGPVQLLVDTGSSYFVIGEAMYAQLERAGAARYSRDLTGLMADGSRKTVPLYRIAELRLGDDCRLMDIEAAVIAGNLRPILGMNVLEKIAPFTLALDPPSLRFSRCEGAAPADLVAVPRQRDAASTGPGAAGLTD